MDIRQPHRVTRTYTQHLTAPRETVFPLLCPVRECDWLEDWAPRWTISQSGAVERDCLFETLDGADACLWYTLQHQPEKAFVEFLRFTPGSTACRITITLEDASGGCAAHITYSHTSLGPKGDAFLAGFTEDYYVEFMRDWEKRLNYYLENGRMMVETTV